MIWVTPFTSPQKCCFIGPIPPMPRSNGWQLNDLKQMTQNSESFFGGGVVSSQQKNDIQLHYICDTVQRGPPPLVCSLYIDLTYPYTLYPVVVVSPPRNSSSMALMRSSGNCGPKPSLRWTPNQWGSNGPWWTKSIPTKSSNTKKSTKMSKIQLWNLLSHIIPEKQNLPLKKMFETSI